MSSGSNLAFSNPSSGKIDQQRKILEELERQKRALNKGSMPSTSSSSSSTPTANNPTASSSSAPLQLVDPSSTSLMPTNQRNALDNASKTSFGYFVPQDSSFGNLILPVIPRFAPGGDPSKVSK